MNKASLEMFERIGKSANERDARIAELEAALRGLVEAVKAGEAVSGAEAMGTAEAALQKSTPRT